MAMFVVFSTGHLIAAQLLLSRPSRGEVLLFKRQRSLAEDHAICDEEKRAGNTQPACRLPQSDLGVQSFKDIHPDAEISDGGACLYWDHVDHDINGRMILQGAHGWLQPGTVTLLMVSD